MRGVGMVPAPIPPDLNIKLRLASASVIRDSTGSCSLMKRTSSVGSRSIAELEFSRCLNT